MKVIENKYKIILTTTIGLIKWSFISKTGPLKIGYRIENIKMVH